jgi:thiopurine S-methyltransferase
VDANFWRQAWHEGRTGWHRAEVHDDLVAFEAIALAGGPHRVLVPLCGRTLDLLWLRAQGHEVTGVEIVGEAIAGFFALHGLEAERRPEGAHTAWRAHGLTVLEGDLFDLEGRFDRVWDRGAMVAVDPTERAAYARVVRRVLAPGGLVLLNVFDHDGDRGSGPPFAVPEAEIRSLYAGFEVSLLGTRRPPDMGAPGFTVNTWLVRAPASG